MAKNKTQKTGTPLFLSARLIELSQKILTDRESILGQHNMIRGQDEFLFALLASDGMTMGSLAEKLSISASSATKAAIKLEAANLVRREASRVDSRQNYAFLTQEGRDMARTLVELYDKHETELFARLKTKDTERLARILDRLESKQSGAGKKPKKAGVKKKQKSKKPKNPTRN